MITGAQPVLAVVEQVDRRRAVVRRDNGQKVVVGIASLVALRDSSTATGDRRAS